MGILDNLENAWDGKLFLESKPIPVTDNMGRETCCNGCTCQAESDHKPV